MVPALTVQVVDDLLLCDENTSDDDESHKVQAHHHDLRNMLIACRSSTETKPLLLDANPLLSDANSIGRPERLGLSRSSSADVNAPSIDESFESESLDGRSSVLSFLSDQELPGDEDVDEPIPEGKVRQQLAESKPSAASEPSSESNASFMTLRITYLLVTLVIMLADGLQGKTLLAESNCFIQ